MLGLSGWLLWTLSDRILRMGSRISALVAEQTRGACHFRVAAAYVGGPWHTSSGWQTYLMSAVSQLLASSLPVFHRALCVTSPPSNPRFNPSSCYVPRHCTHQAGATPRLRAADPTLVYTCPCAMRCCPHHVRTSARHGTGPVPFRVPSLPRQRRARRRRSGSGHCRSHPRG